MVLHIVDDSHLDKLAFFKRFVSILNGVDDPDVDDPDEDWEERLGWAWGALAEFAEQLGPDFEKIVIETGEWTARGTISVREE
jgi:hypothetical protein